MITLQYCNMNFVKILTSFQSCSQLNWLLEMDAKNCAVVILVILHLHWSLAAETREEIWKEFSGGAAPEKQNPTRFQVNFH